MKMPRGIFITYVCDGVGSSAVSMKVGKPTFIMACLNWHGYQGFFSSKSKIPESHKQFPQIFYSGIYEYRPTIRCSNQPSIKSINICSFRHLVNEKLPDFPENFYPQNPINTHGTP